MTRPRPFLGLALAPIVGLWAAAFADFLAGALAGHAPNSLGEGVFLFLVFLANAVSVAYLLALALAVPPYLIYTWKWRANIQLVLILGEFTGIAMFVFVRELSLLAVATGALGGLAGAITFWYFARPAPEDTGAAV